MGVMEAEEDVKLQAEGVVEAFAAVVELHAGGNGVFETGEIHCAESPFADDIRCEIGGG